MWYMAFCHWGRDNERTELIGNRIIYCRQMYNFSFVVCILFPPFIAKRYSWKGHLPHAKTLPRQSFAPSQCRQFSSIWRAQFERLKRCMITSSRIRNIIYLCWNLRSTVSHYHRHHLFMFILCQFTALKNNNNNYARIADIMTDSGCKNNPVQISVGKEFFRCPDVFLLFFVLRVVRSVLLRFVAHSRAFGSRGKL